MKTVLTTIAMILSTQSLMAQSIYCSLLKGEGSNYEAVGQYQEIKFVSGTSTVMQAPDKSFTATIQMVEGDRYSLSLYKGDGTDVRRMAFSLTSFLSESALVSATDKVGIFCSKKY